MILIALGYGSEVKAAAVPAHLEIGAEQFEAGDLGAARDFFTSRDRRTDAAWIDYFLGRIHLQLGETDEAVNRLRAAVEADAHSLAPCYQFARTAVMSETHLERAIEYLIFYLDQPQQRGSPAAEHAHWRLGMLYQLLEKNDLAAAQYRRALDLDPKHDEAKKALAALGSS